MLREIIACSAYIQRLMLPEYSRNVLRLKPLKFVPPSPLVTFPRCPEEHWLIQRIHCAELCIETSRSDFESRERLWDCTAKGISIVQVNWVAFELWTSRHRGGRSDRSSDWFWHSWAGDETLTGASSRHKEVNPWLGRNHTAIVSQTRSIVQKFLLNHRGRSKVLGRRKAKSRQT